MRKIKGHLFFLLLGSMLPLFGGFSPCPPPPKTEQLTNDQQVAIEWANMTLQTILASPNNTPTYSSRALAYMGITMYESVVHSSPKHRSLARQLNGLTTLPQPETGQVYNWPLVLNAGQYYMLHKLYAHAPRYARAQVTTLYTTIAAQYSARESADVVERSTQYGWALASTIFDWSKTDGGHEGYTRNFDLNYQVPKGNSYWVSPKNVKSSGFPLHPTWGANRTFTPASGQLAVPLLIPYSTNPASTYYKEFATVFEKSKTLTNEQKEIALWWSDDPVLTFSPPGHSYNLATTVIKLAKANLVKAAETYARVGMCVADAFIHCWKCKYTYHRERPSTFIMANMAKDWKPYWPEPPFPAFPSGHATQAAAATTALAQLYGENFELTDSTHYGHPRDSVVPDVDFKPRHFKGFSQIAIECANSRFYGGIHTLLDNKVGLAEGKKVGSHVNALSWYK